MINVVSGDGPVADAALVRHPGVEKVAFTGSTCTGGEIMRLACEPITRVTLELGGTSPSIVFADADLGEAVASAPAEPVRRMTHPDSNRVPTPCVVLLGPRAVAGWLRREDSVAVGVSRAFPGSFTVNM